MPSTRAVVFVTDADFVVPTLVAATQVLKQVKVRFYIDIYIMMVGLKSEEFNICSKSCISIGLIPIFMKENNLNSIYFHKTHVPITSLMRFDISKYLPNEVKDVLYLDGDIQIVGDISKLLMLTVESGYIAAANDKYWLGNFGRWKSQNNYLKSINIKKEDYFNAGVLAFCRETWDLKAPEAMDFFMKNSRLCKFHDQTALNAVFKGKRKILNPEYNFISDYNYLNILGEYSPRIIHFSGGLKPWYYSGLPWYFKFSDTYTELLLKFPLLKPFINYKTSEEQYEMHKFEVKRATIYNLLMISPLRRKVFRNYINKTKFVI